jgi:hypothetical protein
MEKIVETKWGREGRGGEGEKRLALCFVVDARRGEVRARVGDNFNIMAAAALFNAWRIDQ